MDGMLSQEEINALLNGADLGGDAGDSADTAVAVEDSGFDLSAMEKDTIGEVCNISMGSAATTLSSLVNQKVDITTPNVSGCTWGELVSEYDKPSIFIQIKYIVGLNGTNIFILKENDVKIITDLMMGGDGTNTEGEIGELQLSAICEAMNQMMGSASTSLSSMMNEKIDISPPSADKVDVNEEIPGIEGGEFLSGQFVRVSFKMQIGELVDSEIMQVFPVDFCKRLCDRFLGNGEDETPAPETAPEPIPAPEPTPAAAQQSAPMQQDMGMQAGYGMPMQGMPMQGMPMQGMPMQGMPMQGMPMQGMQMGYGMPMQGMYPQSANVQGAQFQAFSPDIVAANQRENIGLIMDVPLEVTVDLGRARKSIQDILEFSPGTIIELDKIAGEPVDVLVNGKLVAKGEVVVIEESFGVRVTDIIK